MSLVLICRAFCEFQEGRAAFSRARPVSVEMRKPPKWDLSDVAVKQGIVGSRTRVYFNQSPITGAKVPRDSGEQKRVHLSWGQCFGFLCLKFAVTQNPTLFSPSNDLCPPAGLLLQ